MIDLQSLPNRKENEQTVLLLRRHWIVPAKILIALGAGGLLPMAIYFVLQSSMPNALHGPIAAPALTLLASFYYLAIWMLMLQEIVDFYLDTWIVTTERVIDTEQFGLFRRETKECHLANIVDVTSEMNGMMQTMLKYGNVTAQTAGEKGQLDFKEVPNPEAVRQTILKLIDEDRARHERSRTQG